MNSLKKLRAAKGLTQEQLSVSSGVPKDTISRLELGGRFANAATLYKLATALEVDLDELADITRPPKERKPSKRDDLIVKEQPDPNLAAA